MLWRRLSFEALMTMEQNYFSKNEILEVSSWKIFLILAIVLFYFSCILAIKLFLRFYTQLFFKRVFENRTSIAFRNVINLIHFSDVRKMKALKYFIFIFPFCLFKNLLVCKIWLQSANYEKFRLRFFLIAVLQPFFINANVTDESDVDDPLLQNLLYPKNQ